MNLYISKTDAELGRLAALDAAATLRRAIDDHGGARLLLSTGASQFSTLAALVAEDVDWRRVEMFHLDEYIGLPKGHPASFIRYLNERFVGLVRLKAAHFVDPSEGVEPMIARLTAELNRAPIDVGLIGIGENGHIAFNDPPADFDDESAYKTVTLDAACRFQQLREGWFETLDDVPAQAASMTVKQIMKCEAIISAVPYAVKAKAVRAAVTEPVNPNTPATILRTHPAWRLYLDEASSSLLK